jgi:hypothetical protein
LTIFLRVDPDLLAAAAEAAIEDTGETERFRDWVARLPAGEQQRWPPASCSRGGRAPDLVREATRWPCSRVAREGAEGQAAEDPLGFPPGCEPSLSSRRRNSGSVTVGQEVDRFRYSSSAHLQSRLSATLADSLNGLGPLALPVDIGLPHPRNGPVATVNER